MKRIFYLLIVVILLAFAFSVSATPQQEPPKEKAYNVGWIPQGYQTSPWWQIVDASFMETVKESPHNIVVYRSAPTSHQALSETINFIEDFASKGVNLIVMSGENPEPGAMLNQVKKEYGIGAVLVNSSTGIPGYEAITKIGSDQVVIASTLGKWVNQKLGGKGKIAYIEGVPGITGNEQRKNAFLDELKGPGYQVVGHGYAEWARDKAIPVAEDILQAHPDVTVIYGLCDEMALGALKVVQDMGLQDKVMVVGIDGNPNAIESILAGGLAATIAQRPDLVGKQAVDVINKLIEGKQSEIPEKITCPVMLVDKTNAEEYKKIVAKYTGVQ